MSDKLKVCVLFGSNSTEHDVSCVSASNVIKNLNQDKYEIIPIGISKDGKWYLFDINTDITKGNWESLSIGNAVLLPSSYKDGNLLVTPKGKTPHIEKIDVVFPVIHGKNGEDGTLQGLLELSGVPYVGCGVLTSAVCMDKAFAKIVFEYAGIPQADWVTVTAEELKDGFDDAVNQIENKLGYPNFIKPSNSGSSIGINKAHNREELIDALKYALKFDRKIVVEEFIDGHEVECAVLGNYYVDASTVGEIAPTAEFYDFEAKYQDNSTQLYIPAKISEEKINEIREYAKKVFLVLDGTGLSRIDFFVTYKDEKVILNEINTLPGFTNISMYPKLWDHSGIPYTELLDKVIDLAFKK